MHINRRLALAVTGAALAAVALAACSSISTGPDSVTPKVPANITAVKQSSPTAEALAKLGYLPVYVLKGSNSYIWAHCPTTKTVAGGVTTDLTNCSKNVNLKGVGTHPNVFMLNGKLKYLQGIIPYYVDDHYQEHSAFVVYVTIPDTYQANFGSLTTAQQKQLLGLVQSADKDYDQMAPSWTTQLPLLGRMVTIIARSGYDWPSDVQR